MGSIEVFDFKQRKWIPYVPDFEKWQKHFWDIHEGRVKPDYKGRYIVGSGSRENAVVKNDRNKVEVKLVTPVAQALEMAKSELAREEAHKKANEPTNRRKRKSQYTHYKKPKKSREAKRVTKRSAKGRDQLTG